MSGDSGESYSDKGTEYGAPVSYLDVSNIPRHEVLNFEGTPTQFYDESGLRGILTRDGKIKDVSSFNPIVKAGEKITANTPIQQVDEEGVLLYADGEGVTRRNTGTPAIGGTLGDQSYMREIKNKGLFGTIGGDLLAAAKDPYFHKFLAAAAIMAGGAALAGGAAGGAGGATGGLGAVGEAGVGSLGAGGASLGPVATSYPVTGGGLIAGTELAPLAAGGLGVGEVAVGAGGIGGGLGGIGGAGGAGGTGIAGTGITGAQALQAAKMVMPVLSAISGGGAGGGGSPGGGGGYGPGGGQVAYNPNGPWNAPINPGMFTTGLQRQAPVTAGIDNLEMLFPELDPALARQFAMSGKTGSNLGGNYFAYGSSPSTPYAAPLSDVDAIPMTVKDGGAIQAFREGGAPHIPEFITGATGHYVKGRGDGQADLIPAMLADGEYVFDSDTVAQLGNGSSDAGAKVLDKMREEIRHHKRSAPVDSIPPKAKSPLEYIKLGMKRK